jgi:LmbE family N-acetylglucosaminyl deacetylase
MLRATFGQPGAPLSILCLGAHADDIEIGCGGTIMRLLSERAGSRVHWVVFAASAERQREARASAAAILAGARDATVEVHDFRESYFPYVGDRIKDEFEKLRPRVRPDVVFTHRARDLHQDHRVIGELTWNTFRDEVVLEYEIPKYEGDLGQPNVFVDLERQVADRKIALLMEHFVTQRQRRWFRPETFEALLRLRGVECAAATGLAEGFHARKLTF